MKFWCRAAFYRIGNAEMGGGDARAGTRRLR
jgi:hypothetical protein